MSRQQRRAEERKAVKAARSSSRGIDTRGWTLEIGDLRPVSLERMAKSLQAIINADGRPNPFDGLLEG